MTEATAKTLLRPHYPALDGLRGVAVLAVCLTHFCTLAWPQLHDVFFWGFASVDLFFVLSGFLITGILLDTLPYPRFFRNFYLRRALRILPVFLFVWAILFAIAAFLHPVWSWYQLSFLVYLGNLFMAAGAGGYHPDPSYFFYLAPSGHRFYATIGHLWTLCQEEQFYLVWPAAVALLPNRKLFFRLCLAGSLAVLILRFYLAFHTDPRLLAGDLLYYNPFTRFDSHLIGAALALYVRTDHFAQLPISTLRRHARVLLAIPVLLTILLAATIGTRWPLSHHHPIVSTLGFTLDCIASTGLLLACLDPGTLAQRILRHPALITLGRVSYALYLFHFLPFQFYVNQRALLDRHHLVFLIPVIGLSTSYAAAHLSYRLIERPFLRLQSVLAPKPAAKLPA